jgi:cytochrome c oxidase subunit 4
MAEHDQPTAAHSGEHSHPGAKEYLGIAVILTVITAVEVAVFYIPAMKPMLVPTLLTLSALKFALVAMFYMHLKFDARLFSWLFVVPMIVIAVIIILLLRLFGKW